MSPNQFLFTSIILDVYDDALPNVAVVDVVVQVGGVVVKSRPSKKDNSEDMIGKRL